MFTAIDKSGNRVFIDDATKTEQYYCPACGSRLLVRQGKILSAHFAHNGRKNCDLWQSGEMSDWHKKMQSLFPLDCQEVVLWNEGHEECHIADALLKKRKTVFEFQHSAISRQEFVERSFFFLQMGYAVVWVFDFQDESKPKRIYYTEEEYNPESKEHYIHFVWPGSDRVRFLDGLSNSVDSYELLDYEKEGLFSIVFHLCTGLGEEIEHEDDSGRCWTRWEYTEEIPGEYREHYFAFPNIIHKSSIKEFDAVCYGEDEFYDMLSEIGAKE